jgi:hypothetical protein
LLPAEVTERGGELEKPWLGIHDGASLEPHLHRLPDTLIHFPLTRSVKPRFPAEDLTRVLANLHAQGNGTPLSATSVQASLAMKDAVYSPQRLMDMSVHEHANHPIQKWVQLR